MVFIWAIVACVLLSILTYSSFDRVLIFAKVDYKRFPIKVQQLINTIIGVLFIIPIIIVRITNPQAQTEYWYIIFAALLTTSMFTLTLDIVGRKINKTKAIKEKIIELKLSDNNDLQYIKNELKSWYDISISTKQIQKILEQMKNEKISEEQK